MIYLLIYLFAFSFTLILVLFERLKYVENIVYTTFTQKRASYLGKKYLANINYLPYSRSTDNMIYMTAVLYGRGQYAFEHPP